MAFTWLNPLNWFRARRHAFAYVVDTTPTKRHQWVARRAADDPSGDFRLDRDLPHEFSFLVLGDTGEGDASQLLVADAMQQVGADTEFAVIVGDIVYPAGRSAAYRDRFYLPYRHYAGDVYAIPGQHDWYDELVGFMAHFCGDTHGLRGDRHAVDPDKLADLRAIRHNRWTQPNAYFHLDHPSVRIVGIDTGMGGGIDAQQLAWLRRVSAGPKPKILLLHEPIFVDGRRNSDLDDVLAVTATGNYRLVVAGDTHNFQRYRIPAGTAGAPQPVWHLVNGGGGAYLMPTDAIPQVQEMDLGTSRPLGPDDFGCFPPRTTGGRQRGNRWARRLPAWLVDDDRPPYDKSFLKVDVAPGRLRVSAFVVSDFSDLEQPLRPWWEVDIPTGDNPAGTDDAVHHPT